MHYELYWLQLLWRSYGKTKNEKTVEQTSTTSEDPIIDGGIKIPNLEIKRERERKLPLNGEAC